MIGLFGARWERSGAVATVLLLVGPVVAVQAMSIALLTAVGRPDVAFRFRVLTTAITVAGFVLTVNFGIVAVASAYVVPTYLLLPLNLVWMRRYAGIGVRDYLARLRGVAAASTVMVLVMIGARLALGPRDPGFELGALLGIGAVTYGVALWFLDRALVRDVLGIVSMVSPIRLRAPASR
jgi:O-antigen/teichoic acid export membrane protein